MKTFPRSDGARAGFTLLEFAIAGVLLLMTLGAAGLAASAASESAHVTGICTDVEGRARRTLDRMATELASTGMSVLNPDPGTVGTSNLTFQRAEGATTAGVVQWSADRRLDLQPDPADPVNGADDDGDGAIDEQQLVLTWDIGTLTQESAVICTDVTRTLLGETVNNIDDNGNLMIDEPGFVVSRSGQLLTLRLSLQSFSPDGRSSSVSVQTTILLRN